MTVLWDKGDFVRNHLPLHSCSCVLCNFSSWRETHEEFRVIWGQDAQKYVETGTPQLLNKKHIWPHEEELRDWYRSPGIVRVVKFIIQSLVHRILAIKPLENDHLEELETDVRITDGCTNSGRQVAVATNRFTVLGSNNMKLAPHHNSGARKFEVLPRFLENLFTLG
jgi:hypothetical protein